MTLVEIVHWITSLPLLDQLSAFVADQVLADPSTSKTGIESLGYTSSFHELYANWVADLIVASVAVSVMMGLVAMVCITAALWKIDSKYVLVRRQNA